MTRAEQDSCGSQNNFTAKEKEVLMAVARGCSPGQIPEALGLKYNTTRFRLYRIRAKTGQHNTVGAVKEAYRLGIITLEDVYSPDSFLGIVKKKPSLTPREAEVLVCMIKGFDRETIAKSLNISPSTVGTHITHIFDCLGVASKKEAIAAAIRASKTSSNKD